MLTIAAIAVLALIVWVFGSTIARVLAAIVVVKALCAMLFGAAIAPSLRTLALGITLWLAGHLLAAYRDGAWRSRIAEQMFTRSPLRVLNPITRRGKRTPRKPSRARNERGDWERWEDELDAGSPKLAAGTRPSNAPRRSVGRAALRAVVRRVPGGRALASAVAFLR